MQQYGNISFLNDKNEATIYLDENLTDNVRSFLREQKVIKGVVCFSGSRPTALPWKYNEECELCQQFKRQMSNVIDQLISKGYKHFITGLALGFDTIITELLLKKEGIYIECALPSRTQTHFWKPQDREKHLEILEKADKVVYTSEAYFDGVYAIRNKYMVDNSDLLIAVQFTKTKGTQLTIDMARKAQIPRIIFQ